MRQHVRVSLVRCFMLAGHVFGAWHEGWSAPQNGAWEHSLQATIAMHGGYCCGHDSRALGCSWWCVNRKERCLLTCMSIKLPKTLTSHILLWTTRGDSGTSPLHVGCTCVEALIENCKWTVYRLLDVWQGSVWPPLKGPKHQYRRFWPSGPPSWPNFNM